MCCLHSKKKRIPYVGFTSVHSSVTLYQRPNLQTDSLKIRYNYTIDTDPILRPTEHMAITGLLY